MPAPLTVDVFADVVCPWCYIGEGRLMRALDQFKALHPGHHVDVHWHPFQLQPDLPADGLPWRLFAEQKFGGWARAQALFRYVQDAAREDDIPFDFEAIPTAPNTTDAHRLILLADASGRTWEMAETLFAAYFTEGRDLTQRATLVDLAVRAGLPTDAARARLATDAARADVAESQHAAESIGITGVPFFIIDRRYGLHGAQPVARLLDALETAAAEQPVS
jgi:predicted DsbA family dithiol-disulfide isomerase